MPFTCMVNRAGIFHSELSSQYPARSEYNVNTTLLLTDPFAGVAGVLSSIRDERKGVIERANDGEGGEIARVEDD
jgi:hypothetical protein